MTTSDLLLRRVAVPALILAAIAGCDQSGDKSTKAPATTSEVATADAKPATTDATATKPAPNRPSIAEKNDAINSTAASATGLTTATAAATGGKGKGKADTGAAIPTIGNADDTMALDMSFDPPKLDLGIMQPGVPKTGTVKITNNGSEAIQIKKAVASCGCTTPTWPKDPIGPGETAELEITLKPSLKQGQRLSKRVTLQMVSGAPQVITVEGEVGLFVTLEPDFLDASKKDIEGQGTVVLESAD